MIKTVMISVWRLRIRLNTVVDGFTINVSKVVSSSNNSKKILCLNNQTKIKSLLSFQKLSKCSLNNITKTFKCILEIPTIKNLNDYKHCTTRSIADHTTRNGTSS